jgi:hypothetical protein
MLMTDNEIRMECLRLAASRSELTAHEITKIAVSFENYVRGIRTTEANTGHPAQIATGLSKALVQAGRLGSTGAAS